MIRRFLHALRVWIGLFFVGIGSLILPERKKKIAEQSKQQEVTVDVTKESLSEVAPLRFTDLNSYIEQLQQPVDKTSACISISHTLISLSKKKNTPVRINLSLTINFDKTGESGSEHKCYLSEFKDGKWRKLKDLDIGVTSIVPLVDEVIGAMGQNGWGCMDNSREQLHQYLQSCIAHNQKYVKERCEKFDIKASIGIHIFLIVDVNENAPRNNRPQPQILTKVSVRTDRDSPVESAQFIYFTHKPMVVEKPAS